MIKKYIAVIMLIVLLFSQLTTGYAAGDPDSPPVYVTSTINCGVTEMTSIQSSNITFSHSGNYSTSIKVSFDGTDVYSWTTSDNHWTFDPSSIYSTHKDGKWTISIKPIGATYYYGASCSINVIKPVLYFLPGIMGSELLNETKTDTVWLLTTLQKKRSTRKIW